jgi:cell division protein FtsB
MSEERGIHRIFIKIGLVVGVVILFFVVSAIHKETVKKNQIQAEIDKLRIEAEKTARENSMLHDKIEFLSSREYMETEARDKLNLKSPDEKVVIVKKNVAKETIAPAEPTREIREENKISIANHVKWWDYFFKY